MLAATAWVAPVVRPAAPGGCAYAAGAHHVALLVQHGSGAALTRCVGFDGPSLTGEQVLQMGGIQYQTAEYGGSLGKAVCQIDGEPATYPPGCFSSTNPYWVLFAARAGGAWSVSNLGASAQTFRDGDAQGWRYDPQGGTPAAPPPATGVCQPAPTAAPGPPAPAPASIESPAPITPTVVPVAIPPTQTPSAAPSPSPSASPIPPVLSSNNGAPPAAGAPAWGLLAAGLAVVALLAILLVQAVPRLRT